MKRLCASTLVLLVMTMNCSALAQENWVFTASTSQTENYAPQIVTTPTYETQLKTTLAEPQKTFSENHPIIAGLGLGVALLGLGAVSLLMPDNDDDKDCNRDRDKRRHHDSCNECRPHHRNI